MANRIELLNDLEEALRIALDGRVSSVWTSLPGIITKVNFQQMTVEVQPAIQAIITNPDGTTKNVNLPLLVDVPIVFPSAGGFTLTFPIKAGDEVLVILACRCIDSWWQSGNIGTPVEARMHDLSDGFAIPGPKSQPKKLSNISSSNVQLRNDSGSTFVEITPSGDINLKATNINVTGKMKVTGEVETTSNVKIGGNVEATGNAKAADFEAAGGIKLTTHKHISASPGVQTGPAIP